MFKKKKIDIVTNDVLYKENQRLMRENALLRQEIEAIHKYKSDYEGLIAQAKDCKKRYEEALEEFKKLENSYKAELDKIINKK
ncbi:hypothetical protein [uncultured Eubacterium sp.]|uniref:hypothetical protein n=1 Tax=uncultured Eubacterium sp. TaxID=165185 RepID=UPI0025918AE3|nr:hypothetical protein [uncultured Eubacterium sp.]